MGETEVGDESVTHESDAADGQAYERPQDVRDPSGERADGRPTGPLDEDGLRPGIGATSAPTEAVEEEGARPTTEHAPGGDL